MPIQIGSPATLATIAQLGQMRADLSVPIRPGLGLPWSAYRYTGPHITQAGNDLGDPQSTIFGSTPADAVALELWTNGYAADDYLFFASVAGGLGSTGVLATNITANLAARRYVASGAKLLMPLAAMGGSTAAFRVGVSKTGATINGRWIASASNLRYRLSSATQVINLTGAGANQTLPSTNVNIFPETSSQAGIELCIVGTAGSAARMRIDGVAATAVTGDPLLVGQRYFFDAADMGLSWASINLFLPSGVNAYGNTYSYA